jgi:hypothetical protein
MRSGPTSVLGWRGSRAPSSDDAEFPPDSSTFRGLPEFLPVRVYSSGTTVPSRPLSEHGPSKQWRTESRCSFVSGPRPRRPTRTRTRRPRWPTPVPGVIALVRGAYAGGNFESAKNTLASSNEQGCPLWPPGAHAGGIDLPRTWRKRPGRMPDLFLVGRISRSLAGGSTGSARGGGARSLAPLHLG